MSSDWIKMRTDLYRDPKVCMIADILMDEDSALSCYVNQHMQRDMTVTRNVMRNVTVGALVSVWGVLRHRGKRNDDDLVVKGCSVSVIDDIADLPGFGDAMLEVGWVEEDQDGFVFPRFFEEFNIDPTEETKKKNAERQRKYREKLKSDSNELRNVTVTSQSNVREEKRREEKDIHTSRFSAREFLKSHSVDDQHITDWLAIRKTKKLPLTKTASQQLENEAKKAGVSIADAVRIACENGWAGFKASWKSESEQAKPSSQWAGAI